MSRRVGDTGHPPGKDARVAEAILRIEADDAHLLSRDAVGLLDLNSYRGRASTVIRGAFGVNTDKWARRSLIRYWLLLIHATFYEGISGEHDRQAMADAQPGGIVQPDPDVKFAPQLGLIADCAGYPLQAAPRNPLV